MVTMINSKEYYEDELSLKDIVNIFSKYKKSILLTPLIVVVVALVLSWIFISPCYQAFATIQIGQVDGKLIEEGAVVEQRMKDPSFISNVLITHLDVFNNKRSLSAEESFLQKTLVVKKSKDAGNLISFNLLGISREVALNKANAVFETLKISHDSFFNANVEMINQQIRFINDQLTMSNKNRSGKARGIGVPNSYDYVMDSLVLQDQSRRLIELENKKMSLIISLSPALTYNTRMLGSVWVSREPVTPNYQTIALMALISGLLLAILGAFIHNSLTNSANH